MRGTWNRLVLSIPRVWWLIVSGALHNFNMYALGAFVAPFLVRFHRLSFLDAGGVAAAVYGFSGTVGLAGGGALADCLYRARVDGRLIVATGAIAICAALTFLSLGRPRGDVWGFALLMGAGCGVMYVYYATVYATIHDVVEPSMRGTAMALGNFCAMYLLGASLGPVGTGLASDYFTFQAASAAGAVAPLPFDALMLAELAASSASRKGSTFARWSRSEQRACTRRCISCLRSRRSWRSFSWRRRERSRETSTDCRRGCRRTVPKSKVVGLELDVTLAPRTLF